MTIFLIALLSLLPQLAEPWKHQLDLEPMLRDSESLKKLTVMYDLPLQRGFELLFVRGDGSLILQEYPGRPMSTTDLPTCTQKIGQDQVKELASLISKHLWELPEKDSSLAANQAIRSWQFTESLSAMEVRRRGVFLPLGSMVAGKKRFPMTLR